MKRFAVLLMVFAASSGCGRSNNHATPAAAYQHWRDRFVAATHLPLFGLGGPCSSWHEDKDGGYYEILPVDQCYKMDPPRRWVGLWRNEFEGSRFCPAPAKSCGYVPRKQRAEPVIWLETNKSPDEGLYAVEFIGRRTSYNGSYGHMGMSDAEIVVDRMISIKQVEMPPK